MLTAGDFEGRWQLSRQIDDKLLGQAGTFDGTAELTGSGNTMHYREDGQIRIGDGQPMTATRRYRWTFTGEDVNVTFADGQPFHRFVPEGCVAGTEHPCGNDLYRVTYDFSAWPEWTAIWTVVGPRKDYTSRSRYCR
ncbi:hypothetical protein SAMN04488515_0756 [Cognatiyoonia koreensis]|uniref:DUF6314 domain-containing protein n=1 Tax=Cognatiyoonia koreensis TaxID=364200 RepID=A0A1I0NPY7_9RHOB|nr:DUF6314 family protein [Cognatiyoonia koreensis]SEW03618.1 hypothetical protein SAMN04488515_0756 [Cognatiyoonia koreensis]